MHRILLALAALAPGLAACDAGSTPSPSVATPLAAASSRAAPGAGVPDIARPWAEGVVLDDPHSGGIASTFAMAEVRYGRAVELWSEAPDGGRTRVARDFVIGPDYAGDGQRIRLETQPVLGTERLVIGEDVHDRRAGGRDRFESLAVAASASTRPLSDAGLLGSGVLSEVPRNAALELRFTDLLDVSAVAAGPPRLLVGDPPLAPFDARIIEDPVHGGRSAITGELAPTRLIVDLAPRASEAPRSHVVVPAGPLGLPPATSGAANVALRIATAGPATLRNLAGASVAPGVGSVDLGSVTQDVVRPFSSGAAGGPNHGFLPDGAAPRLVARADVVIVDAPVGSPLSTDEFTLPRVRFASVGCAGPPQVGDILRQTDLVAEVITAGPPAIGGELRDVEVRLLSFPAGWSGPAQWITDGAGPARYDAPYDLSMDERRVACLVDIDPDPLGAPTAPTRGVDPMASFTLSFNEPIAPESLENLEASMLGRAPLTPAGSLEPTDIVVASLALGPDGESIRLTPVLPLAKPAGQAATYWLTARTGVNGATDLAGAALEDSPGPIAIAIDASFPAVDTDGLLWRFDRFDEGGLPGREWSGQVGLNLIDQRLRPRPATRFQTVIDRAQPQLAQMTPFPFGAQTPLNPLGARMQTAWRYADMGFGLTDPATINLDVEGLSWSPAGGQVVAETYGEFEIALAHSQFAPDEYINPATLFPQFQNSGLRATYDGHVLAGTTQEVVHARPLGYVIDPGDLTMSQGGTPLMPFPLNRDPAQPSSTYTWRDTEIRERAGFSSGGVEPLSYLVALGIPVPPVAYYRAGDVQTLGLPLLMDFSTWPDPGPMGMNRLDINLAVNSSSRPYFRAFTAGGTNQSGSTVLVDPAQETTANGGFNPGSNPPGAATFGRDNSVYLGAVDFVVRKSVAHSVWVDAGSPSATRSFVDPILSPAAWPGSASVRADVRLASGVQYLGGTVNTVQQNDNDFNGVVDYLEDALTLDLYGDYYADGLGVLNHDAAAANPGLTFAPGSGDPDAWRATAAGITGARFVQVRLVLESDMVTGARPSVSAVGLAWEN